MYSINSYTVPATGNYRTMDVTWMSGSTSGMLTGDKFSITYLPPT
jgi:hypothetical protein